MMSRDRSYDLRDIRFSREPEQSRSLFAQGVDDDDAVAPTPARQLALFPPSSPSRTVSNGFPSTTCTVNRVGFGNGETDGVEPILSDHAHTPSREGDNWLEAEDSSSRNDFQTRNVAGQRVPLLTDVEAPSVMVAEDLDFNAEGVLESARPKSGIM